MSVPWGQYDVGGWCTLGFTLDSRYTVWVRNSKTNVEAQLESQNGDTCKAMPGMRLLEDKAERHTTPPATRVGGHGGEHNNVMIIHG